MAIGDVRAGMLSVLVNEYVDIRPPEGEEWVIHNIYYSGSVKLYFTDGTNHIMFDTAPGPGGHLNFNFHVTYNYWIRVMNASMETILVGYDGVRTK